jgi:hypothetical protein
MSLGTAVFSSGEGLQKLVGEGRQGDFVHQNQKMGAADGFRNVSEKWLRKTITYEQGLEKLAEGKALTRDITATVKEMVPVIDDKGRFSMHTFRLVSTFGRPDMPSLRWAAGPAPVVGMCKT